MHMPWSSGPNNKQHFTQIGHESPVSTRVSQLPIAVCVYVWSGATCLQSWLKAHPDPKLLQSLPLAKSIAYSLCWMCLLEPCFPCWNLFLKHSFCLHVSCRNLIFRSSRLQYVATLLATKGEQKWVTLIIWMYASYCSLFPPHQKIKREKKRKTSSSPILISDELSFSITALFRSSSCYYPVVCSPVEAIVPYISSLVPRPPGYFGLRHVACWNRQD